MAKNGDVKGKKTREGEKGKKPKLKKGSKCKFVLILGAVGFALVCGTPYGKDSVTDMLIFLVSAARYYHEGVDPFRNAFMDGIYVRSEMSGRSLMYDYWFLQHKDMGERMLLKPAPGDDHITALCKVSMYTQMVTAAVWENSSAIMPPGACNMDTHDPGTTEDRVNAYLQACIEVYSSMDKNHPQKKLLDKLEPVIKENISTPFPLRTDMVQIIKGKVDRQAEAEKRELHEADWKPLDEIPEYGFMFNGSQIRPVKEEVIDASEISEAIRQGRVAVFDATKLLGKEIFNMSMVEIAELHMDTAASIPMYRQKGATAPARSGIDNLKDYAAKVKAWKKTNSIRYPDNAPMRPQGFSTEKDIKDKADAVTMPARWLRVLAAVVNTFWFFPHYGAPVETFLMNLRSVALQCAVNTRRLPKLPIPNMEEALGNPDWLERTWSMFWLGPVADCWHYDDPDNLLIGIYGDIWVTVFMLEDRELMRSNADRGCWSPMAPLPHRIDTQEAKVDNKWLEKYKFIHLKLTPGTGVVVPSGAFHSLTMVDGDRVLMNCFMIPKYKGLWDAPAANHSFYSHRWQTEEYHALSQLKKSSIFRLWDTKKLGGFFEGAKLEML